jgi:hypothetical protein
MTQDPGAWIWTWYNAGQILQNGSVSNGEIAQALATWYASYTGVRVNAMTVTVSNNAKGDAASGAIIGASIASGDSLTQYSNPEIVYNELSELNCTKTVSNDWSMGVSFPYLRDQPYQEDPRRTRYHNFSTSDVFATAVQTYYPKMVYAIQNGAIPNGLGYYPAQITVRIQVCLEFFGNSLLIDRAFPPGGWIEYITLYAQICESYRLGIGHNPDHIKRALRTMQAFTRDPDVQQTIRKFYKAAKLAGSVALTVASTLA